MLFLVRKSNSPDASKLTKIAESNLVQAYLVMGVGAENALIGADTGTANLYFFFSGYAI